MVGISRIAIADDLAIDFCVAGPGVFEFLEQQHACALAHDESIALPVKRPGGVLGIVVARGECLHCRKAAHAHGHHGRLSATRKDSPGITHLDGAPCLTQRVGAGGTGAAGGHVGSAQSVVDGENPGRHVQDEHGNHEWGYPLRPSFHQNAVLVLLCCQTSNPATDESSNVLAICIFKIQTGVLQGFPSGKNTQLRKTIRTPDFLGVGKCRNRIKILHLRCDLAGIVGNVKGRNTLNSASTGENVFPELV